MNILKSKAYFMLPGFVENYELYKLLNSFLIEHPEAKIENTEIYCYYGNFPFCSWDGGRIFESYQQISLEKIKEIINYYNNVIHNKLRLVFTNSLLNEQDCYDRYNNIILQELKKYDSEIVINSPILEDYILKNYPEYKLISSTTKCLSSIETAKQELNKKQYLFSCLDYNLNHNWDFLNNLSIQEKNKTEFLINPICKPNCPSRQKHYYLNSLFSLTYGEPSNIEGCTVTETSILPSDNKAIITIDEIFNEYIPNGFNFFKIEGRAISTMEVAMSCANYLIKPEYRHLFLRNVFVLLYVNKKIKI